MLQEGHVLAGKYRLDRFLHNSGASTLWAATNAESNRSVALKVLSESLPEMPEAISRFVQDGRNASKPLHPMIVRVEEVGHTGRGIPFMVMELLEGQTLREEIEDQGVISLPRAVAIIRALLQGLSAAHGKGAVHGNIKPENIFLSRGGDKGPQARILNFGISRPMIAPPRAVKPKQIIGRLDYLAPELLLNPGSLPTPASDVFSCGVLFSEMITGSLPLAALLPNDPHLEGKLDDRRSFFGAGENIPPPSELLPTLFPGINNVVIQATKTDSRSRLAQASQVLSALEGAIANHSDLMEATVASTDEGDGGDMEDPTMMQGGGGGLGEARTVVAAPSFDFEAAIAGGGGLDAVKTALFDSAKHGDLVNKEASSGSPFGDPFANPSMGRSAPVTAAMGSNLLDSDGGMGQDNDIQHSGKLEQARTMLFDGKNPPAAMTQKLGSSGGGLDDMANQAKQGLGEAKTMLFQPSEHDDGGALAAAMLLNQQAAAGNLPQGVHPSAAPKPDWAGSPGAGRAGPGTGPAGSVGAGLGGWVGGWQPGQQPRAGTAKAQPAAPKKSKSKGIIIAIIVLLLLGLLVGGGVAAVFVISSSDESSESSTVPATPGAVPTAPAPAAPNAPAPPHLGVSASTN
jgi:hypothetical protein